jgi:hypothetical protein
MNVRYLFSHHHHQQQQRCSAHHAWRDINEMELGLVASPCHVYSKYTIVARTCTCTCSTVLAWQPNSHKVETLPNQTNPKRSQAQLNLTKLSLTKLSKAKQKS